MLRYILSTISEVDEKPTSVEGKYVEGDEISDVFTDEVTGIKRNRTQFVITSTKELILNNYVKNSTKKEIFTALDGDLALKQAQVTP